MSNKYPELPQSAFISDTSGVSPEAGKQDRIAALGQTAMEGHDVSDATGGIVYDEPEYPDINEDEDAWVDLVEMSARFFERNNEFTMADWREHLLKNEAIDPQEIAGAKVRSFYYELQGYVDEYLEQKQKRAEWYEFPRERKSEPVHYLVQITSTALEVPDQTELTPPISAGHTADVSQPHPDIPELDQTDMPAIGPIPTEQITAAISILHVYEGEATAKSITSKLAKELDTTREHAQHIFDSAVDEGRVFPKNIDGRPGYALTEVISGTTFDQAVQKTEKEQADSQYVQVVGSVMRTITGSGAISTRFTFNRLWLRSGLEDDMTKEEFNKYVRRMSADGLIELDSKAKIGARRSGVKARIANSEVWNGWKHDHKQQIRQLRSSLKSESEE